MNILVLGGNGFIGSHVVDALFASGHAVRVFDRSPDPWGPPRKGVTYFQGSFDDSPLLGEAMQGVDAVIHLISTTVPSTSNLDPVADIQSNLVGTVRLLELMRSAGVRRIVYFSSGGTVYGIPHRVPIREDDPLNPICSYGVVKVAIEKYVQLFQYLHGLHPIILRPSNPYGPRQGHVGVQGVVATFVHKVLTGEKIIIWGDGSVKRDFIEVSDLARLCRLAVESDVAGTFNVGSGVGHTINDLIASIERKTGRTATTEYRPGRPFDVPEVVLDVSGARDAFSWHPEIALGDGLARYCEWVGVQASGAGAVA